MREFYIKFYTKNLIPSRRYKFKIDGEKQLQANSCHKIAYGKNHFNSPRFNKL